MCNIVLNRMYSGSYLTDNLGHEVINMFQSDNGKHYLYLNARGNVVDRALKSRHMLLVVYVGEQRVEVVGLAKNLIPIESANCSLQGKMSVFNLDVFENQKQYIENEKITYGGVSLLDLFNDAEQQNIYVSYEVDSNNFFKPKKRIVLSFDKDSKRVNETETIYQLLNSNFGSTTLHQYIEDVDVGGDYVLLNNLINDEELWVLSNDRVKLSTPYQIRQDSLIDICGCLFDENKFSNALAYFIRKYPELWSDFFALRFGLHFQLPIKVSRELDIKAATKGLTAGGRVDIQIDDGIHYVIIENKIKSSINKSKQDIGFKTSQLTRYVDYLKKIVTDNYKNKCRTYVLAPNYNMPPLEGTQFEPLWYSDLCLFLRGKIEVEQDSDFKAFFNAMLYHSYSNECMAMYQKMKDELYNRVFLYSLS